MRSREDRMSIKQEIIQDAYEAAEAAVDRGFFSTWALSDDDGPYYGDVEAALRGTIYGDEHTEAVEPWAFDVEYLSGDDMLKWVDAWRERLFELGWEKLGIDAK